MQNFKAASDLFTGTADGAYAQTWMYDTWFRIKTFSAELKAECQGYINFYSMGHMQPQWLRCDVYLNACVQLWNKFAVTQVTFCACVLEFYKIFWPLLHTSCYSRTNSYRCTKTQNTLIGNLSLLPKMKLSYVM